jgi:DNA-binding GntR family transcriptional regulator
MTTEHLRLVDDVVRRLEESILSGERGPGDRLLVLPLARLFGISQSTIREALLMLEQRGLVRMRPRRGAFVSRLSAREAWEICQARALLEAYAVGVGVAGLSDSAIDSLRAGIGQVAHCVLPRDLPRIIECDRNFHAAIMALAGSETLKDLWSRLNSRMGALMMRAQQEKNIDMDDFVRYHTEVIDALATRDPEHARRQIIRHYLRGFDVDAALIPTERAASEMMATVLA